MTYPDFSMFVSYQRWMRALRKKAAAVENGQIPKDTLLLSNAALTRYCAYTKMNPDQLITDLQEELKRSGSFAKHNDMLDMYWDAQTTKTTAAVDFGRIKSFYSANGYKLTTAKPTVPVKRKTKIEYTSLMVRKHCDVAPLPHKAWMMANNYLGMRIGIIPYLTVADFHTENWTKDEPLYPVTVPAALTGTFTVNTYIGHDAMQTLRLYFETHSYKNPADRPWGQYNPDYLSDRFKKYAYDAGLIDAPEGLIASGSPRGLCLLTSHKQRKRKINAMKAHKIDPDFIDISVGHVPKHSADAENYVELYDAESYRIHLEVLPDLEVYGHHAQSPTSANVELKKMVYLDQIRSLPDMTPEKLKIIENNMKMYRTKRELEDAVQEIIN